MSERDEQIDKAESDGTITHEQAEALRARLRNTPPEARRVNQDLDIKAEHERTLADLGVLTDNHSPLDREIAIENLADEIQLRGFQRDLAETAAHVWITKGPDEAMAFTRQRMTNQDS